jgi:hypothetical protein
MQPTSPQYRNQKMKLIVEPARSSLGCSPEEKSLHIAKKMQSTMKPMKPTISNVWYSPRHDEAAHITTFGLRSLKPSVCTGTCEPWADIWRRERYMTSLLLLVTVPGQTGGKHGNTLQKASENSKRRRAWNWSYTRFRKTHLKNLKKIFDEMTFWWSGLFVK